ncbi:ROK family protein [Angustibacter sp. McL0619]|uniref:ROK family protein n=1 Tax=Angustibacter sp. McL0619 TaxID=3415676 RepID=UPI003CF83E7B
MATARRPGTGTNQEAVRRHNLGTVLAHLHHDGQLSRAELTVRMGLNRSTIGALVGELVELGAVVETAPSERPGGRRPAGRPSLDVRPSSDAVYVIAVDVGVKVLQVARIGLGGDVLQRASGRTPVSHSPAAVATAVVRLIRQIVSSAPPGSALLGIGLGVPGVVRERDGVVRFAPNLGWHDVPFAQLLRERMSLPVLLHVGNDADLGVLAEHTRGAGVGYDNVVFLMGDVGLGGGVIVDAHPLQGIGGYAGELGHLIVNSRGRVCRCGSTGCWETEVCLPAISRALKLDDGELDEVMQRLAEVERPSAALREVGRYLGVGLGSVVNVLNPEVVVLGGLFRALFPVVQAQALQALTDSALEAPREQVHVVVPMLGGDAVLIGGAEKAFEYLLADPARALSEACRDAITATAAPEHGLRDQSRASVPA